MTLALCALPLDLLQETAAALNRYVRARHGRKLRQERARLQDELLDMRAGLAEIQALSTGVEWNLEGEIDA